jgi:nucleoside-diphosphate-sugar epimerase
LEVVQNWASGGVDVGIGALGSFVLQSGCLGSSERCVENFYATLSKLCPTLQSYVDHPTYHDYAISQRNFCQGSGSSHLYIHLGLLNAMGKSAFITGANGISGSAILEYLVANTTSEQWSEIIVTSRSPFSTTVSDPRIRFISLDFTENVSKLADKMRDVCKSVTHSYFCSYVHKDTFEELNTANRSLFENYLDSLIAVAPLLENVTLQTGGKHYNVHLHPVMSPAREEDLRVKETIDNFYYPQEDFLISRQKGSKWVYNVVRPEAIIGSTQKPNGMNEALTLALYFSICKELRTDAPMPTNQRY